MDVKKNILSYIALGAKPELPADEVRLVRLVNGLCLLIATIISLFAVIDLCRLAYDEVILDLLIIAMFQVPPTLNALHHTLASRISLLIFGNISALCNCFLLGHAEVVTFTFVPIAGLACAIFTVREARYMIGGILASIVLSLTLTFWDPPGHTMVVLPLTTVQPLSLLLSFALVAALTIYFNRINAKFQDEVNLLHVNERKNQEKLFGASKMASVGQLASGIAHEINNPLAIIMGRCDQLSILMEDPQVNKQRIISLLENVQATTLRISGISKGLLEFSRDGSEAKLVDIELKALIQTTLSFCREGLERKNISIVLDDSVVPVKVLAKSQQLQQILINLLANAGDAIMGQEEPWIRVSLSEDVAAGKVFLDVTDSGTGIAPALVSKLMEPFFTTKEIGKGTGLGLSISKGLAQSFLGDLDYVPHLPNTTFRVTLQKGQEAAQKDDRKLSHVA